MTDLDTKQKEAEILKTRSEGWKNIISICLTIVVIFISGCLIWFLFANKEILWKRLFGDKSVQSAAMAFGPISVSWSTSKDNPTDEIIPVSDKKVIECITSDIPKQKTYWVYLGASSRWDSDNKFFESSFGLTMVPKSGDLITSTALVTKRLSEPQPENGKWKLGDVLGLLESQQKVQVIKTISVPGTYNRIFWWSQVTE